MRIGVDPRIHHRADQGAGPFAALDVGAHHAEGRAGAGAEGAVPQRVGVAARRARLRLAATVRRANLRFANFRALSARCARFGKIIVPCVDEAPSPHPHPEGRSRQRTARDGPKDGA